MYPQSRDCLSIRCQKKWYGLDRKPWPKCRWPSCWTIRWFYLKVNTWMTRVAWWVSITTSSFGHWPKRIGLCMLMFWAQWEWREASADDSLSLYILSSHKTESQGYRCCHPWSVWKLDPVTMGRTPIDLEKLREMRIALRISLSVKSSPGHISWAHVP